MPVGGHTSGRRRAHSYYAIKLALPNLTGGGRSARSWARVAAGAEFWKSIKESASWAAIFSLSHSSNSTDQFNTHDNVNPAAQLPRARGLLHGRELIE